MSRLTRAQRRARKTARLRDAARNPGRAMREPVIHSHTDDDGRRHVVRLDGNANRAKRDAAPLNFSVRSDNTREQPDAALIVATPIRTPTGRIARRGGAPEYTSYVMGSNLPMPVGADS